jgi:hypothetical protein
MDGREVLDGLSAEVIARITGVDITTARRWKRGQPLPETARRLLQIITKGDLGEIDAAWRGWSIRDGELWTEQYSRHSFKPAQVMALPFILAQNTSLQARLHSTYQSDWVDGKWIEPGANAGTDRINEWRERADRNAAVMRDVKPARVRGR